MSIVVPYWVTKISEIFPLEITFFLCFCLFSLFTFCSPTTSVQRDITDHVLNISLVPTYCLFWKKILCSLNCSRDILCNIILSICMINSTLSRCTKQQYLCHFLNIDYRLFISFQITDFLHPCVIDIEWYT